MYVFSRLRQHPFVIESEKIMTNQFKNIKEEKQYYRNKYNVKTLREETVLQIFKDENPSDAFIVSTGNWDNISQQLPLTIDFIKKYDNKINFYSLSHNKVIELEVIEYIIEHYSEHLTFEVLLANPHVTDTLIEEYIENLSYYSDILGRRTLSENILSKYFDLFVKKDGYYLFMHQTIPVSFLVNNKEKINWERLSQDGKLTKEIMMSCKNDILWHLVTKRSEGSNGVTIPSEILDEYINFFDIQNIFRSQPLDEWFLEKHIDKFQDSNIWYYQALSEQYFRNNEDTIEWRYAERQPNIPMDIIEKNVDKISKDLIEKRQLPENILRELIKENSWSVGRYQDFSIEFYKEFSKQLDRSIEYNKVINQDVKNLYNQKMKIKNMLNKNK
jgi:hypothetical protein